MENTALPGYPGTRGLNFWEADAALRDAASPMLTPQGRARSAEFGASAGQALDALVDAAHAAENLPRLVDGAVRYCPEQIEARRLLARAVYGGPEPLALSERMTRAVIANYCGEGGITCPLAMTEGLIGLLEKRGSAAQTREFLPRLKSDDPDWALTGGQFITERQSGSNVAANETAAAPNPDGTWSLAGTKWFCSNPGELWVTTAKTPQGPVALFLVRRRLPDGSLNGHKVLRLKPIGGTRGKATVEVEYAGARAEMIGRPREGLVLLVNEILSVSRLHVAAAALGFAGRAVLEARTFARWRLAYGRPLTAIPSVAARLAAMEAMHAGMLAAFYRGLRALEADDADAEALVPVLKTEISMRGSGLVREAQLLIGGHGILDDFSPLNRLADDAIVNEIWEGTHPILAGHAAKSLRRPRVLERFSERVSGGADKEKLERFIALVRGSRTWSEDERSLRDGELAAEAYLLLAGSGN
ncbi:MAG: acyl-CoA dehydrogenase family protein [Elusimicrobia bacterium]|nr:acyl-CoA dehydrogenase family protein [Elusimicrobiota bacterium]